jgi:hypothetical protein
VSQEEGVRKGKCRAAARSCAGSRTRKKKRSTTGSRSGKGTIHREKEQDRGSAKVSRSEKRDIDTVRKSEKEEVPQREGLIKGKCHRRRRRSKKGTVQKAERVRR